MEEQVMLEKIWCEDVNEDYVPIKDRYIKIHVSTDLRLLLILSAAIGGVLGWLCGGWLMCAQDVLLFPLLLYISAVDFKLHLAADRSHVAFGLIALTNLLVLIPAVRDTLSDVYPAWTDMLLGAVVLFVPLFIAALTGGGIGGGDIKFTLPMGLYLGLYNGVAALVIGLLLLIIVVVPFELMRKHRAKKEQLEYKERRTPMLPFFSAGIVLVVAANSILQ